MLWVGGHILLVGADELGWEWPYHLVHDLEHAVEGVAGIGGVLAWGVNTLCSAIVGLVVGLAPYPGLHLVAQVQGDWQRPSVQQRLPAVQVYEVSGADAAGPSTGPRVVPLADVPVVQGGPESLQRLAERLSDGPRDDVGGAAGGEGNHDPHRPVRPSRLGARLAGEHGEGGGGQSGGEQEQGGQAHGLTRNR